MWKCSAFVLKWLFSLWAPFNSTGSEKCLLKQGLDGLPSYHAFISLSYPYYLSSVNLWPPQEVSQQGYTFGIPCNEEVDRIGGGGG